MIFKLPIFSRYILTQMRSPYGLSSYVIIVVVVVQPMWALALVFVCGFLINFFGIR
jgi:hypothetical protein